MKSWEIMRKEIFIMRTKMQSTTHISLQILSLVLKETYPETKRTNERNLESAQGDLSIELSKSP
jgi:hypothetical protein